MFDIYKTRDNFEKYRSIHSKCVIEGSIDKPSISVFIPTYKRAETIAETISSAISQEFSEAYEIVIVSNDPEGENSKTREIIESYNDNRIYFYVNAENIGLCGNWNRGIELCRGTYVAMIHDDDTLSPWFLSSVFKAIKRNNYPLILGVKSLDFSSNNKPIFTMPKKLKYKGVSKKSFFFGRYITIAGMTVNREKIIEMGGYDEGYYPNEDTVLIYQALLKGKVVNIENQLAGYRKEVNLSLTEGTMEKIIQYTENTRRNIAQYEKFAQRFMRYFDREYLYSYAAGANRSWGTEVDISAMMREFNLPSDKPSVFKTKVMNLLIKLGSL